MVAAMVTFPRGGMCLALALLGAVGCAHDPQQAAGTPDASAPDASVGAVCANGQAGKLKFTAAQGCANDGGVEFCAPAGDASLMASLAAISPSIQCSAGGGRANCARTPGLLLCSYPTSFPSECTAVHGAMTTAVWTDMCALAGLPAITEIVPTILE